MSDQFIIALLIVLNVVLLATMFMVWGKDTKGIDFSKIRPTCFGSNPGPQARAENDCWRCRHYGDCLIK